MAYSKGGMFNMSNYTHLKTLPALLSIVFAMTSLYLFGGVSTLHLEWFNYTLTTSHALIASLAIFAVAFMSSETKNFAYYSTAEKAVIASGPILMLAYQYVPWVATQFAANDPVLPAVAFLLSIASWSAAVR